jgi:hypothetical protein
MALLATRLLDMVVRRTVVMAATAVAGPLGGLAATAAMNLVGTAEVLHSAVTVITAMNAQAPAPPPPLASPSPPASTAPTVASVVKVADAALRSKAAPAPLPVVKPLPAAPAPAIPATMKDPPVQQLPPPPAALPVMKGPPAQQLSLPPAPAPAIPAPMKNLPVQQLPPPPPPVMISTTENGHVLAALGIAVIGLIALLAAKHIGRSDAGSEGPGANPPSAEPSLALRAQTSVANPDGVRSVQEHTAMILARLAADPRFNLPQAADEPIAAALREHVPSLERLREERRILEEAARSLCLRSIQARALAAIHEQRDALLAAERQQKANAERAAALAPLVGAQARLAAHHRIAAASFLRRAQDLWEQQSIKKKLLMGAAMLLAYKFYFHQPSNRG